MTSCLRYWWRVRRQTGSLGYRVSGCQHFFVEIKNQKSKGDVPTHPFLCPRRRQAFSLGRERWVKVSWVSSFDGLRGRPFHWNRSSHNPQSYDSHTVMTILFFISLFLQFCCILVLHELQKCLWCIVSWSCKLKSVEQSFLVHGLSYIRKRWTLLTFC